MATKNSSSDSSSNPPLLEKYTELLVNRGEAQETEVVLDPFELPVIDLSKLKKGGMSTVECMEKMANASSEWGFFQVVNHGVSLELMRKMKMEEMKLFKAPFDKKTTFEQSYRWGSPSAVCTEQFSWSEAFHVPLTELGNKTSFGDQFTTLREVMAEYAAAMQELAKLLSGLLVKNMGRPEDTLEEICDEGSCYMRMNRYPVCPLTEPTTGLVAHTDSDYLTILHQDEVGGLQLLKDNKWVAVKPNQDALIVNIGDLFQAWSNDAYKSVEHKVMANKKVERFSIAYFLCPLRESHVGSCGEPSVYRDFTFGQYRDKIQEDVKNTGRKFGLCRFLLEA